MSIELLNIDCNKYMDSVSDNKFQLCYADPPYGINAPNMQMGSNPNRNEKGQYPGVSTAVKLKNRFQGSGKLKNRALNSMDMDWDNTKPSKSFFSSFFRISANQFIWGANYFNLPPTRGIFVWNKNQPWDNFSQCELAWTSFDMPARLFTFSNRGGNNLEEKIHPCQKPLKVCEEILKNYAKEGDIVFDSHAGSGSMAIACYNLGFDYIGCEINENYYKDACKRIEIHHHKYAPVSDIDKTFNGQLKLL